jgi:hypothetical protein
MRTELTLAALQVADVPLHVAAALCASVQPSLLPRATQGCTVEPHASPEVIAVALSAPARAQYLAARCSDPALVRAVLDQGNPVAVNGIIATTECADLELWNELHDWCFATDVSVRWWSTSLSESRKVVGRVEPVHAVAYVETAGHISNYPTNDLAARLVSAACHATCDEEVEEASGLLARLAAATAAHDPTVVLQIGFAIAADRGTHPDVCQALFAACAATPGVPRNQLSAGYLNRVEVVDEFEADLALEMFTSFATWATPDHLPKFASTHHFTVPAARRLIERFPQMALTVLAHHDTPNPELVELAIAAASVEVAAYLVGPQHRNQFTAPGSRTTRWSLSAKQFAAAVMMCPLGADVSWESVPEDARAVVVEMLLSKASRPGTLLGDLLVRPVGNMRRAWAPSIEEIRRLIEALDPVERAQALCRIDNDPRPDAVSEEVFAALIDAAPGKALVSLSATSLAHLCARLLREFGDDTESWTEALSLLADSHVSTGRVVDGLHRRARHRGDHPGQPYEGSSARLVRIAARSLNSESRGPTSSKIGTPTSSSLNDE